MERFEMRRIVFAAAAAVAGVGALGACTPEEVQMWQALPAEEAVAQPIGVWDDLAECESGGNWAINTGNGYHGGLQFLGSTWRAYGGGEFAKRADLASREQQITIAERVRDDVGFSAWPSCSRRLGLR